MTPGILAPVPRGGKREGAGRPVRIEEGEPYKVRLPLPMREWIASKGKEGPEVVRNAIQEAMDREKEPVMSIDRNKVFRITERVADLTQPGSYRIVGQTPFHDDPPQPTFTAENSLSGPEFSTEAAMAFYLNMKADGFSFTVPIPLLEWEYFMLDGPDMIRRCVERGGQLFPEDQTVTFKQP